MTKKLTPSHIAVAVAAGLTAQTAMAQTPVAPAPSTSSGQEVTPMIKLDNNQYAGQGFFDKPNAPGKKNAASKAQEAASKPMSASDAAASVSVAPVPAPAPTPTPAPKPAATPAVSTSASKTPIKDPMLPLDIVGSKDAKENTKGGLTPPLAKKESVSAPATAKLQKPDALLDKAAPAPKVAVEKSLDKTESMVKASAPVQGTAPTIKKKPPVAKKAVAPKPPVVEAPFSPLGKEAIPMEVKEMPSAAAPVAPALYAAVPATPVIVTEVVRIDSISLNAPTAAEQETQPLPRLPEPEPVVAAIVPAPLPARADAAVESKAASGPNTNTVASSAPSPGSVALPPWPQVVSKMGADMLTHIEPPTVDAMGQKSRWGFRSSPEPTVATGNDAVRTNPVVTPNIQSVPVPVAPVAVAQAPATAPSVLAPAPTPVATPTRASAPVAAPQPNEARIRALLEELKTLQSTPMAVQEVQPPVQVVPPIQVAVPKIDPAATIQLPLPAEPRGPIKPTPKEPARMVSEHAPAAPVDVPQTAAIDAPRTMVPAPVAAPVLEARTHRVANPKFAGLPEKGDFIAFMPSSSHVSEETVESLRSMVNVFKQHGIRKIVLTGTALRDEDTDGMESSDFAQQRAKNLKAAFQRAGFKGVIALDDPKRARPGTTPRVGLVALQ